MIARTVVAVPTSKSKLGSYSQWIAQSCAPGDRVLNIGAGCNHSGELTRVLRRRPYLVGIDPAGTIHQNASLDERYQQSMEEFATSHDEEFDIAFSVYVLEHVAQPEVFLESCAKVLRPRGRLFGLTLNTYHYFGLTTWAVTRLGVSDWLLERLKGRTSMDAYHFPTEYRLNSIPTLTRRLEEAGFTSVEFRCFDATGRYSWYLPAALHGLAERYTKAAYRFDAPWLMGHLSFCATRDADVDHRHQGES